MADQPIHPIMPSEQKNEQKQPKNIIICCDGTGNEFCDCNSNVLKLYTTLDLDLQKFANEAVAIGMKEAAAAAEQRLGVDALAVRRVAVIRGRWNIRSERAFVTHDHPQPTGPGLPCTGRQHRDGGVVGMQHLPGADVAANGFGQGGQQEY